MKRLLALLLLCAPAHASGITSEEWQFVCRSLAGMGYKVQCRNIPQPTVIVTKLVRDLAGPGEIMYGLHYNGEPYLFINATLPVEEQRLVVIHETVHYVLWQSFGIGVGKCEGEAAARAVGRLRAGLPPDESWRAQYGC